MKKYAVTSVAQAATQQLLNELDESTSQPGSPVARGDAKDKSALRTKASLPNSVPSGRSSPSSSSSSSSSHSRKRPDLKEKPSRAGKSGEDAGKSRSDGIRSELKAHLPRFGASAPPAPLEPEEDSDPGADSMKPTKSEKSRKDGAERYAVPEDMLTLIPSQQPPPLQISLDVISKAAVKPLLETLNLAWNAALEDRFTIYTNEHEELVRKDEQRWNKKWVPGKELVAPVLETVNVDGLELCDGSDLEDRDLQSLHLANYQLTLIAKVREFPNHSVEIFIMPCQPDDLASARRVCKDPKGLFVRVVKVSRFDLAFSFPRLQLQTPLPRSSAVLRNEILTEFWQVFEKVSEALGGEQEALGLVWKHSQPSFLDFPFDLPLHSLTTEAVTAAVVGVASKVEPGLRPVEWSETGVPFTVVSISHSLDTHAKPRPGLPRMEDVGDRPVAVFLEIVGLSDTPASEAEEPKDAAPKKDEKKRSWRAPWGRNPAAAKGKKADAGAGGAGGRALKGAAVKGGRVAKAMLASGLGALGTLGRADGAAAAAAAAAAEADLAAGTLRAFLSRSPTTNTLRLSSLRINTVWGVVGTREAVASLKESSDGGEFAELRARLDALSLRLDALCRDRVAAELRAVGLVCKLEVLAAAERDILLVGIPNSVLERQAEASGLLLPVAPRANGTFVGGFIPEMFLRGGPLRPYVRATEERPRPYEPYFLYTNGDDPSTPFSPADRARLLLQSIQSPLSAFEHGQPFRIPADGGADLDLRDLLEEEVIDDYVLLHDLEELKELKEKLTLKHFDSDRLRSYFGEQLAFYFVFLRAYTWWLTIPGALSIAAFLFTDSALMHWFVARGHSAIPTNRLLLVIYAFAIALGATLFLEFWKRKSLRQAHVWGVLGADSDVQSSIGAGGGADLMALRPRPEFVSAIRRAYPYWKDRAVLLERALFSSHRKEVAANPVCSRAFSRPALHAAMEERNELYYYPPLLRGLKVTLSFSVCLALTALLIAINYVVFVVNLEKTREPNKNSGAGIGAGIASGFAIPLLNALYKALALRLTEWEFQRSDADHEQSLALKLFLFRLVNGFCSLFFVAFISRNIEVLSTQLASILITGSLVNDAVEIFAPMAETWYREYRLSDEEKQKRREIDSPKDMRLYVTQVGRELSLPQYTAMSFSEDVLELVLQFGYATFFVAAFPAAPFVAFLANVAEFYVDSYKLESRVRRPLPIVSSGIGTWQATLEFMGVLSVITNVAVVGVTEPDRLREIGGAGCGDVGNNTEFPCRPSDFIWLIVLCEHALLALKVLIMFLVPPMSAAIVADRHRQGYFDLLEKEHNSKNASDRFQKANKAKDD